MVFKKRSRIDEMVDGPSLEEVEAELMSADTATTDAPLWTNAAPLGAGVTYSIPSAWTSNPLPDRDELIREWSFDLLKTIMATRNMKVNNPLIDEVVAGATYLADKLGVK